jgi:hypothetical protein
MAATKSRKPMLALHLDEIRWRNDFYALVLT